MALPFLVSPSVAKAPEDPRRHCCEPPGQDTGRRTLDHAASSAVPGGLEVPPVTLVPSPLRDPQILVANDKACQLLGYSSHDLIGQKLTQFFLKPDSDVVKALSEEHVEADGHAAVVFGTVVSAWRVPPGPCKHGRSPATAAAVPPSVLVRGTAGLA